MTRSRCGGTLKVPDTLLPGRLIDQTKSDRLVPDTLDHGGKRIPREALDMSAGWSR